MKYFVVTPAYESGGDGLDPPDYGSDVAEVEAIDRYAAKSAGLKELRKMKSGWIHDCEGNPFKGLKVYKT